MSSKTRKGRSERRRSLPQTAQIQPTTSRPGAVSGYVPAEPRQERLNVGLQRSLVWLAGAAVILVAVWVVTWLFAGVLLPSTKEFAPTASPEGRICFVRPTG